MPSPVPPETSPLLPVQVARLSLLNLHAHRTVGASSANGFHCPSEKTAQEHEGIPVGVSTGEGAGEQECTEEVAPTHILCLSWSSEDNGGSPFPEP